MRQSRRSRKPIETVSRAELDARPGRVRAATVRRPGSRKFARSRRRPPNARLSMPSDPERAAAEVIAELDQVGALKPRAGKTSRGLLQMRKPRRGRDVWVVVETNLEGSVTRGSLELLSRADQLATQLGGAVVAAGFGASMRNMPACSRDTARTALSCWNRPRSNLHARNRGRSDGARCIKEHEPWGLFLSASERGRDWGPRLAARLGLGLTGDAIGLEIDEQESSGRAEAGVRRQHRRADSVADAPADGDGAFRRAGTGRP